MEKSLQEVWAQIEDNKDQLKAQKGSKNFQQKEIDEMKNELALLKSQLEKEKENNAALKH